MFIGAALSPLAFNRTISAISLLLLGIAGLSLSYQSHQLWQLLNPEVVESPTPAPHKPAKIRFAEMAKLFGESNMPSAPPTTNLHLILVASFPHPDIARSSAIIGQPDEPARRIMVGESIHDGIVLSGVFPKHVTLTRNSRSENLYFAENPRLTSTIDAQPAMKRRSD